MRVLLFPRRFDAAGGRRAVDFARAEAALEHGRAAEALELAGQLDDPYARIIEAAALLRLDRPREAQHVLLGLPDSVATDPTFEATVLLANGNERLARERLAASLADHPAPWAVRELAALLVRRGDDLDEVLGGVRGDAAVGVSSALIHAGRYADSARWSERALSSGVDSPYVAYDAAYGWARAGDVDRALRSLDRAVRLGFDDVALLDGDDHLAPVRAHPGWADVRGRVSPAEVEEATRGLWLDDDHPLIEEALQAIGDDGPAHAYAVVRRHRGPGADNISAAALILLGRLRRAERRLRRIDPIRVNYALPAALLLLRGREDDARELLAGYPGELVAGLGGYVVAKAARRRGRDPWDLLDDAISDGRVLDGAGAALLEDGAYAEAAEWLSRGDTAANAYNAACAWALAGDAELALRWLHVALDRGLDDDEALVTDEDLAPLRTHPGWAAVRARLGDPDDPH